MIMQYWTIILTVFIVPSCPEPQQQTTVSIDNNAFLTLGTLAAVGGTAFLLGAYHNGRKGNRGFGGFFGNNGGYYQQPYYYPQQHYYPSHNSYQHYQSHYRRRRETPLNQQELSLLTGELLEKAFTTDTDYCGLSLVCELGKKPRSELPLHALTLTMLLGNDPNVKIIKVSSTAGNGVLKAFSAYQTALDSGTKGKDCEKLYKQCKTSPEQLYKTFVKIPVMKANVTETQI